MTNFIPEWALPGTDVGDTLLVPPRLIRITPDHAGTGSCLGKLDRVSASMDLRQMMNSELDRPTLVACSPSRATQETVVLVHGLAAHRLAMWPLARHLARGGFQVINWGYPSIAQHIDWHAERLAKLLLELERRDDAPLYHLVTHSMGSIIARTALRQLVEAVDFQVHELASSDRKPELKLKHLVMLGPPNRGSPVARLLAPYLGWMCPPLYELADDAASYVNRLAQSSCGRCGIVAAERDYVVPLSSTCLAGQTDHIVVPGRHTGILFSRGTAEEVEYFLHHGRFRAQAKRLIAPADGNLGDSPSSEKLWATP